MNRPAIEALYDKYHRQPSAISEHMPTLRRLASGCDTVCEFGVKRGMSTTALLLGCAGKVYSWDVVETPQARQLEKLAGERWVYTVADSKTANVPECDLLFIDSLHNYEQVKAELLHADKVRRYLVFHDVTTFGEIGADGETGRWTWEPVVHESVPAGHWGVRPAIDEFMVEHWDWRIAERHVNSHGLLVLQRGW